MQIDGDLYVISLSFDLEFIIISNDFFFHFSLKYKLTATHVSSKAAGSHLL